MSMKPGRDGEAGGVELGRVGGVDLPTAAMRPSVDRDVGAMRLGARAVVDRAVADHELVTRGCRRTPSRARGPRRTARARTCCRRRAAEHGACDELADRRPELEAVPLPPSRGKARRTRRPGRERMPVRRHLVEADLAADAPQAVQPRQPRLHTRADVGLERVVDRLVVARQDRRARSPSDSRGRRGSGRRPRDACRRGRPATRSRARATARRPCRRRRPARAGTRAAGRARCLRRASSTTRPPRARRCPPRAGGRRRARRGPARAPRPASLARLCSLAPGSVDERARRGDRIGEAGVGLVERVRDALGRNAEVGSASTSSLERTLAQLHLAVPARRLRSLLVDEEEPAAALVVRLLEVHRAGAHGHPHDLRVRVVRAHERARLAGRRSRVREGPASSSSASSPARASSYSVQAPMIPPPTTIVLKRTDSIVLYGPSRCQRSCARATASASISKPWPGRSFSTYVPLRRLDVDAARQPLREQLVHRLVPLRQVRARSTRPARARGS